jgi:GTPase SAR1 family protein
MFYDEFDGTPMRDVCSKSIDQCVSFYGKGVILVSDLTSRSSYDNLKEWIYEVMRYRSRERM